MPLAQPLGFGDPGAVTTVTYSWPIADLRASFADLAPPYPAELVGSWDGELVGRPALLLAAHLAAAATPFRGWCGKAFLDPAFAVNRVRRHGLVRHGLAGKTARHGSRLDGRPALVISYRAARWPWRHFRGELRAVSDDEMLGMLMLTFGRTVVGPFPFRLVRV